VIDRRTFIGTLAGGILASPMAAFAQQPTKVPRIGVIGGQDAPPWAGFRQGLRELGYVDGRNVTVDWRWSGGNAERLPTLASELVQLKVDIIVVAGTPATRAAKQATSTIPIVMAVSGNADKIGLVESLAHPGGNITGLSNVAADLTGKRLQYLKEIAPKVSRVAVIWFPESAAETVWFSQDMLAAAAVAGLTIQSIEMRTSDNYAAAFAAVTGSRGDALYVTANTLHSKNRQLIADFALKSRLPSMYEERLFVEAGGLMSYAPSYIELFRRAATYVDKILKGAKPADLPIEQPTAFELVINPKTAKVLGLTIPQSLGMQAELIE
jgi:putative tryptophan/tyrosine transport system substrate-binding protein